MFWVQVDGFVKNKVTDGLFWAGRTPPSRVGKVFYGLVDISWWEGVVPTFFFFIANKKMSYHMKEAGYGFVACLLKQVHPATEHVQTLKFPSIETQGSALTWTIYPRFLCAAAMT